MNSHIKITICTACYNSGLTIRQTIESVMMQTYPHIEYIIVDGLSIDGTMNIVAEYGDKIKSISEPDSGLYDAFNKAIDLATGDYIQFVGADDCLYDEHVIQKVVNYINKNPNKDFYCGNRIRVYKSKNKFFEKLECNNMDSCKKYNELFWSPHTSMFVKTSIMKKEKFVTDGGFGADYYFILKSFYVDKYIFAFINYPIAYFADGGISSDIDSCYAENEKIKEKLGLVNIRKKEKMFYIIRKLFRKIIAIKNINKEHHCSNKVCRWCSRGG